MIRVINRGVINWHTRVLSPYYKQIHGVEVSQVLIDYIQIIHLGTNDPTAHNYSS